MVRIQDNAGNWYVLAIPSARNPRKRCGIQRESRNKNLYHPKNIPPEIKRHIEECKANLRPKKKRSAKRSPKRSPPKKKTSAKRSPKKKYDAKILELVDKLANPEDGGVMVFLATLKQKIVKDRVFAHGKQIEKSSDDELEQRIMESVEAMTEDSKKDHFNPIVWLISKGWFVYPDIAKRLLDEVVRRSKKKKRTLADCEAELRAARAPDEKMEILEEDDEYLEILEMEFKNQESPVGRWAMIDMEVKEEVFQFATETIAGGLGDKSEIVSVLTKGFQMSRAAAKIIADIIISQIKKNESVMRETIGGMVARFKRNTAAGRSKKSGKP